MSWAFNGARAPESTHEENTERASGVRLVESPYFIVVGEAGATYGMFVDILDAIDEMREFPVGCGVVTPDGRLMAYQADSVSAQNAERQARKSVAAWKAMRGMNGTEGVA